MPINVFVQMPSCVPRRPGLENAGATHRSPGDVAEAMGWPNIIGLGEMMNFPGVVAKDEKMLAEIAATQRAGKTVGGHYASPDLGRPFHGYVAGGPADDHEGTRAEDAIARVRLGMRAMLRLGSAWYDVAAQVKAITERGLDSRNFILCTDDRHSGTLVNEGHMDRVVRHAIAHGLKPITAIQMATLNTATHFGLERELGSITPGRRADLILTSDLATLPIEMVIARGVGARRERQARRRDRALALSGLCARHGEGRRKIAAETTSRSRRPRARTRSRRGSSASSRTRRRHQGAASASCRSRAASSPATARRTSPDRGGRAAPRHRQGRQRASSRASATTSTAPWPRPSRTTATR